MVVLNWLPWADVAQPIYFFVAASMAAWKVYSTQAESGQNDLARYPLLAAQSFKSRMEEDGYAVTNILLSQDLPWWWVECVLGPIFGVPAPTTSSEETRKAYRQALESAFDKCLPHGHLLDTFCCSCDAIGRGIVRATMFVSECGGDLVEIDRKLEERGQTLFKKFKNLGHGAWVVDVKQGDPMPWVVTFNNPAVTLLLGFYEIKKGLTVQMAARVAFGRSIFSEELGDKFLKACPAFSPKNFGSGPQNRGLFIQEVQALGINEMAQIMGQIQKFIETLPEK